MIMHCAGDDTGDNHAVSSVEADEEIVDPTDENSAKRSGVCFVARLVRERESISRLGPELDGVWVVPARTHILLAIFVAQVLVAGDFSAPTTLTD